MEDDKQDDSVLTLLKEGLASLKKENYKQAVKAFDLVLGVQPENVPASQGKAVSLARLGKREEAEAHLTGFIERNPRAQASDILRRNIQRSDIRDLELIPKDSELLIKPLLNTFAFSSIFDLIVKTQSVEGFLTNREGAALFHLAQNGAGRGEIVEIGSFCGKSTIFLGTGSKSLGRGPVYAIDPHIGSSEHQPGGSNADMMPTSGSTYPAFQRNIRDFGLKDIIKPIVKTSQEAANTWDKPIRLLFIDGAHEFEMVEQDYHLWSPFLISGGLIAFHDCNRSFSGPRKVVERHILSSHEYETIAHVDSLYVAERVSSP